MLNSALKHIESIESYIPSYYSKVARHTVVAYSLYVLKLAKRPDHNKARQLVASSLNELPREALGWLLFAMVGDVDSAKARQNLIRKLENIATETSGTASFATSVSDGAHLILHSSRRADAIILEALIETKPKHDLVSKLARGLLAHRKNGRWKNTQENVFVLLAMDRYFRAYESVTPDFVARAWLGNRYAGEHRFRGRTTERHRIDVPMSELSSAAEPLTIERAGSGRLYYRVGMRYAPTDLKLPPADHGFAVERTYEHVDDPKDVVRQADGSWHIAAGARVRVRLTMAAPSRRYHVALVDPLAAGLEPMNAALKITGPIPTDPSSFSNQNRGWWWSRTWFEHQNMRDERVEAFASIVWAGVHQYSYVATATTPGTFVVPPAKAEEMYAPETFGRSASDQVVIK